MKKKTVRHNEPKRPRYRITVFSAFLFALIIDQLSKHIMSFQGYVQVNQGVSFGLFSGPLLTFLLLLFFLAFYAWSCPRWHKIYPIASGLLLGGAMSNIVDRLVLGGVRDFLPLPFLNLNNNLADWFIVGSLLYIAIKTSGFMPLPSHGKHKT